MVVRLLKAFDAVRREYGSVSWQVSWFIHCMYFEVGQLHLEVCGATAGSRTLHTEMSDSRTATSRILLTLRLDRVLKEKAEAEAAAENRNLNNFIETTLMERLGFRKVKQHKEELVEA